MRKLMIVLFALTALSLNCEARIFSRCQLVRELRRQGFPARQMRNWVCLIEAASRRNTGYVTPPSSSGSRGWGLFQIWDPYWCSTTNVPGKFCNVRCADLITDNIRRASNCAKLIYSHYGFNAWNQWTNRCRHQSLPDISYC